MNLTAASILSHVADTPIVGTQKNVSGLSVTVEHPKNTLRKLHNDKGEVVYKVHMHNDYGFINKTKGQDGDEVDCFLGPMKDAPEVYVVHMLDKGPDVDQREDEDKCFIGFASADMAKTAFLLHYPPSFYGGMTSLPTETFKKRLAEAQKPHRKKKITAGGPGSGRHPEHGAMKETLEKQGYVQHPAKTTTEHYIHKQTRDYITLKPESGEWHQKDHGDTDERGIGVKTLRTHLGVKAGARNTGGYRHGVVSADACPRCGSKDIGLMPTDFETGKCRKCGKLFTAKNAPKPGGKK